MRQSNMRGSNFYGGRQRNSRKSVFGHEGGNSNYLDEIQENKSERSSVNPYNDYDDLEEPGDKIRLTSTI